MKASTLMASKWWLFLLIIIAVFIPLKLDIFWVYVVTEMLMMSLFAMSFALLYGHMGHLSFGQAAYFGAGAYTVAILMTKTEISFPLCLLAGVVVGGLWALIAGPVVVRLTGIYFAIMSCVVAQVTFYVLFEWYSFTGGDNGIQGIFPPGVLRQPLPYYYMTLIIVVAAIVVYWFIVNSPFGRSLRCIRDNMERTTYVGIPVRRHMLIAFVIAGLYAGLAGALFAPFNRSIAPYIADWMKSGDAVFMGVLGGVYTLGGPVLGAVLWVFLDSFISDFTEYWPIIMGFILLLVILFMRGGILGVLQPRFKGFKWTKLLPSGAGIWSRHS